MSGWSSVTGFVQYSYCIRVCPSSHRVRTHLSWPWPVGMCASLSGRCVWSTMPSSDWPRNRRQYTKHCCPVKAPALDTGEFDCYIPPLIIHLVYFVVTDMIFVYLLFCCVAVDGRRSSFLSVWDQGRRSLRILRGETCQIT